MSQRETNSKFRRLNKFLFEALLGLAFATVIVLTATDFGFSVPFVYQGL